MTGFRLDVREFERTAPAVRIGVAHPEQFVGIPSQLEPEERAEAQPAGQLHRRAVICGDTPVDRLVIALCVVAFIVIVIFGGDWAGALL